MRDEEFGRGQNHKLGWNDPVVGLAFLAKAATGSLQPITQEARPCFARVHTEM